MTRFIRRRTASALLAALATPAPAQEAGGQALRVIIPQPPGGATDVLARLLSEPLSRALERPVVVENRPGANGIVAINALRQSRPDGGTLLLGGVSIFSFNPNLYPSLPYDPWRDFAWIAPVADTPFVAVAGRRTGVGTMAQLLERARARPEGVTYGSAGIGNSTHLAMEMIAERAGVRLTHVPFAGSAPALASLAAGDTDCMVNPLGNTLVPGRRIASEEVRARRRGHGRAAAADNGRQGEQQERSCRRGREAEGQHRQRRLAGPERAVPHDEAAAPELEDERGERREGDVDAEPCRVQPQVRDDGRRDDGRQALAERREGLLQEHRAEGEQEHSESSADAHLASPEARIDRSGHDNARRALIVARHRMAVGPLGLAVSRLRRSGLVVRPPRAEGGGPAVAWPPRSGRRSRRLPSPRSRTIPQPGSTCWASCSSGWVGRRWGRVRRRHRRRAHASASPPLRTDGSNARLASASHGRSILIGPHRVVRCEC